MNNKEIKIALILKTNGLEYDDRIRKEILSFQRLNPNIHFKIFAMLPKNEEIEGVSDYGVPYKTIYIPARSKYPSRSKVLLKAYQFWEAVKKEVRDFDVIWTADSETLFITLLAKTKCLIWDLHELPTGLMTSWYKRLILRHAINRTSVSIHANNYRRSYLESLGVVKYPERHFVLSNYPEPSDNSFELTDVFCSFLKWKGERSCVYLQGITDSSRAAYESIAAILGIKDLCAVVIGRFDEGIKAQLESVFSEQMIRERLFFVGQIPQNQIANYMRECIISAIFYKNTRMNNYLCDANRFYLAASQGLPVVVGNNPSMREIIDKYHLGISIDSDGSSIEMVQHGIEELLNKYDYYKQRAEENKEKLLWGSQDSEIVRIIEAIQQKV